ncbi:hypothetical protein [Lacrimispora sphenoides]|uniref:Uncharacterized protein n=1 Tax=Lacrimispora sphenoides JCM 1415 TaxID=1297793 RepID=A0ABY1CD82_9FIRM|nr:hypothetical protein [Lacrimispora sphenoides]SET92524.1 hypothetical protein SAMN02745906_3055 [[Clostridium] sphenoides JCM 1415]SUY52398.1 Uncharacterised protein [Lacrimispora sphenoides]
MYKISAVFLSVILSFSLFNVAFAKEMPNFETHSITAEPEGIVLEVDSQEEFEALRFSKVHDFLVTPHVNYTGVNNVHWQYEYLDSNRTVAVNTSFIVSIKEISGNYHNYDVTKYVEYYASGGVRGW